MFSEFDPQRQSQSNDCTAASLDNLKRDRFELLSAYLDGEVTPQERRQVEGWLRADESMQCLYARLLQLRQQMQSMPIPASASSADDMAYAVCERLDRRSRRPYVFGGVMAIAAVFCAFFSSTVPISQQARNPATNPSAVDIAETIQGDGLMLSLNESLIQTNSVDGNETMLHHQAVQGDEHLALSLNQPLIDIPEIQEN